MSSLKHIAERWEALAQEDPLWAICADPAKRNGRWQEQEFFAAGEREIETVLAYLRSLNLAIDWNRPALDFGCGAGRLTRALASRSSECWGVDISPTMIEKARALNHDQPRCKFHLNQQTDLRTFADWTFGFVYSSLVLQHIHPKFLRGYLTELVRVLRPGGVLVFQMADHFNASVIHKLRLKIALRRRWQELKTRDKATILMHYLPEQHVRQILAGCDVRIMDVRLTSSTNPAFNGNLHYLDREAARGYVSKQYCVVKNNSLRSRG